MARLTLMMTTFTDHVLKRSIRACTLNWRSRWCNALVYYCTRTQWTCGWYIGIHIHMHPYTLYSSKFSWLKIIVKLLKIPRMKIFVINISWSLHFFMITAMSPRPQLHVPRHWASTMHATKRKKLDKMTRFEFQSCVRGFHVCKSIWTSFIGEIDTFVFSGDI